MYLTFIGSEGLTHQVSILDGYVEEGLLASGTVVGHGTLDEMSTVIQFVGVDFFPFVCTPPSAETRTFVGDAGGEITVRFLCQGDKVDDGVEILV